MALSGMIATVSLAVQMKAGNTIGKATAFFYEKGTDLFLVTNQHVVRDDAAMLIPDTLRLRLHTDQNDVTKNADFDVPLYAGADRLWKTHSTYPQADVAVLKLNRAKIQPQFFITAWSQANFLPKEYPLDPGVDIFIMGYPLGFHDTHNNLPLFRNAMIASAYRTFFGNLPLFLTDANLHPGTSGSPVISKPKNAWVDDQGNTHLTSGTTYYLLGVHSATLGVTPAGQQQIPLGLGAAWYASLIEEIVSQF
jgi:S1-C subfamily serine protease